MARLILIRHGESVANLERRFTFDATEPLTPAGVEQARARGEAIRGRYAPVALYSSPFRRALETAEQIGLVIGLAPVVIEDLREQSFGIYHGRPYTELYGIYTAGSADRWQVRPDGGEMLREVALRAGAALDAIARRHLGAEVVVVSHGGVMSALRGWVSNDYSSPPTPTANASGYVLRYTGDRYQGPFDLESPETALLGHLGG
jgi:broad specificity phosphatase PhoE